MVEKPEWNSSVNQHSLSEKTVFNVDSDGLTPTTDKKKTFEKREK